MSRDRKTMAKIYGVDTNYLETIFDNNPTVAYLMSIRCKISGCQYGIEGLDEEPKDKCIWCGRERPFVHFKGVSLPDLVEEHKKYKFNKDEDDGHNN